MSKKNKRITILLTIMLVCFLVALLLLYAVSSAPGRESLKIPAYCLFGVGLIPLGIMIFLIVKDSIIDGKQRKEYLTYPVNEISNFKKELDIVRANFEKDTDKDKNRVLQGNYQEIAANSKPFYDQKVVNIGKIYYGTLVEANNLIFKKTRLFPVLPGVIIYSTDNYFENNPLELIRIANELYSEREFNILQNERNYFSNILLSSEKTNGKKVYMTTVMISRQHLPQYKLGGRLFPIIASPENSTTVFIVDCKYWTKDLIADFISSEESKT